MTLFNFIKIITHRLVLIALLNACVVFSAFAEVENISNQKLRFLISDGVPIVDIREEFEWKDTGVVPESHLITFFDSEGRYDLKKWLDKLEEITNKDEPLIIICRSGRRSLILANYLSKHEKFLKVYNVTQGIKGWKNANLRTNSVK